MPIGVTCRLCERADCAQRAQHHRLRLDDAERGFSPFSFAARDG